MKTESPALNLESACEQAHERLAREGFTRLDKLLDENQVELLQKEAAALLDRSPQAWDQFLRYSDGGQWQALLMAGPGRTTNYLDFIGLSPAIDNILDDLFSNPALRTLLSRVLGTGYRIWYAQIRRAEVGARSLRMHQDKPGEVGLSILLTPVPYARGTTVFLPGSQRWPRLIGSFPFLFPGFVRPFLRGAVGAPGDIHLFYNATWHGMSSTDAVPRTAIILTFLPRAEVKSEREPPQSLLDRIGPHLRSVMKGEGPVLERSGETSHMEMEDVGPDEIVGQRVPPVPMLSLWRLPMIAAVVSARTLALFRFSRRFLRRNN
jgi:putative 2OG-Fe(II) oxygenase